MKHDENNEKMIDGLRPTFKKSEKNLDIDFEAMSKVQPLDRDFQEWLFMTSEIEINDSEDS